MKPTKIMVVEDESIVALNLRRSLMRMGYDVTGIAATRDQALDAVSRNPPDMVLMDINISGSVDGIQTAAELEVPVIYLTAYSEDETLSRAKATHPYGYLLKPFSERELHATIQMALERYRLEAQQLASQRQLAMAYARLEEMSAELEERSNALYDERERLQMTLNSIGDGVICTDEHGNVTYLNPVAVSKTGWQEEQALGESINKVLQLLDPDSGQPLPSPVARVLHTGVVMGLPAACQLLSRSGQRFAIEDSAAPIRNRDGKVSGVVLVFHDVSEARRMAVEMTYQATHDELTGLVNRREFEKRLRKAVERPESSLQAHALAYLDLDQFKIVNDVCGHTAGDELLRQVTHHLRHALRANDTLGRLGGDEFGILLESCPLHIASHIAESVRKIIEEFHFNWENRCFPITASIGLIGFGGSDNRLPLNFSEILSLADTACYAAKDLGRNRVHVYQPNDQMLHLRQGEMNWCGRIHAALKENRFVLYAQKIAPLLDAAPQGEHVELLLRLHDEEGRLVPPMAFIPAAERYGLMQEVDRWVVRSALQLIAERPQAAHAVYSINLSAASLNDERTLDYIANSLEHTSVPLHCLCFEITETAAVANLLNASAFIEKFRKRGCKFALDDFGVGMSSFAYLKHLPVDYLKIDGSFIRELKQGELNLALVSAINDIGHVMGMQTIAEFVENADILALLRVLGVDYAQGYGIGMPQPFALAA